MLANNDEKNTKYYLESIATGALPIFSAIPAVREGCGHMKQTETEALKIPRPSIDHIKSIILGVTSYPVCFISAINRENIVLRREFFTLNQ